MNMYGKKIGLVLATITLAALTLAAFLGLVQASAAGMAPVAEVGSQGWVISTSYVSSTLYTLDIANAAIYGPFLEGELGSPQGLLEVALTPDRKTALVSNNADGVVYFVDVSDPTNPTVLDSVATPFYPGDIAITPDGKYAAVARSDPSSLKGLFQAAAGQESWPATGAFGNERRPVLASPAVPTAFDAALVTIDISATAIVTGYVHFASYPSVDIAPNGVVVAANPYWGQVDVMQIDAAGVLHYVSSYRDTSSSGLYPINARVAPDGKTVLVTYPYTSSVSVYQQGPFLGYLEYKGLIWGLPGTSATAIAFDETGSRAYVTSQSDGGVDYLSTLKILQPGKVQLETGGGIALLGDAPAGYGGLGGIETLGVVGGKAYAGNTHPVQGVPSPDLAQLDLAASTVTNVPAGYPVGVAIIAPAGAQAYLPLVFTLPPSLASPVAAPVANQTLAAVPQPATATRLSALKSDQTNLVYTLRPGVDEPTSFADLVGSPAVAAAAPGSQGWVIATASYSGTLYMIDVANDIVYGPFLYGELGTEGSGLFDVAVTPDHKTALVSNFGDKRVNFVDISDPTAPFYRGVVTTTFFAEDIDITPDGKYAIVTDSGSSPRVVSIDVVSMTPVYTLSLGVGNAQSVAAVADYGTLIFANYSGYGIEAGTIDAAGKMKYVSTYVNLYNGREVMPLNVSVAPDGETVLVSTYVTDEIDVYRVIGPGYLEYKGPVAGLPTGSQSITFNAAGTKAYVYSAGLNEMLTTLSVLNILSPGVVEVDNAFAAQIIPQLDSSSAWYGVDTIGVIGGKAFMSRTFFSVPFDDFNNLLWVVDLLDFHSYYLPVGPTPAGVVIIPPD